MTVMMLMRGLPGSGKTTAAKNILAGPAGIASGMLHYEADMFFEQDGEYKFDPRKLKEAHKWCLNKTGDALFEERSVIVSNTFTTCEEMRPYFQLANDFGCSLFVIENCGQYGSIHNVPEATIEKMKARWTPMKDIWTFGENFQCLKTLRVFSNRNSVL